MSQMQDLTVLIGVNEVTATKADAQMTRRINKVILHNGYDASIYVSQFNREQNVRKKNGHLNKFFFYHFF